jgi:CheY-like chemotaxis protein
VIYRDTLSTREDNQLYLNKAEEVMMASDKRVLVGKMNDLARIIVSLAILSGILFLVSAGVWVWIGLYGS